jgi:DNA-binding MarR family transcriptional regulator
MDKVSISRAVRRLLEFGRIEREPNDADRRERHLRLTPAGQSIYDDIVPAALAYERRIRDALTPEENEALERLIDKLEKAA